MCQRRRATFRECRFSATGRMLLAPESMWFTMANDLQSQTSYEYIGRESRMNSVIIIIRRFARFLLASFLWLHALFFWNPHTRILATLSRYMHLTFLEVTLFVLLFIFSVFCSSGWWSTFKSVLYIYFFPFVLLGYFFVLLFQALKGINAWFSRDQPAEDRPSLKELIVLPNPDVPLPQQPNVAQPAVSATPALPTMPVAPAAKKRSSTLFLVARPFRRFTVLWCALLLFATHKLVLWLSLAVVTCPPFSVQS